MATGGEDPSDPKRPIEIFDDPEFIEDEDLLIQMEQLDIADDDM